MDAPLTDPPLASVMKWAKFPSLMEEPSTELTTLVRALPLPSVRDPQVLHTDPPSVSL